MNNIEELMFSLILIEFLISLIIAATGKNLIKILIGIEISIITANAFLVFFSFYLGGGILDPLVATIIMISTTISAIIAAFILVIIYKLQQQFNTIDANKICDLRW